ncbi:hypothetical protein C1646_663240 [Rhizophagus diaphanus]|nr:hypothetical protein C1646_663240 [Rhizophagus diaphanus] [Rhizophagus sp. MUCL 43196]
MELIKYGILREVTCGLMNEKWLTSFHQSEEKKLMRRILSEYLDNIYDKIWITQCDETIELEKQMEISRNMKQKRYRLKDKKEGYCLSSSPKQSKFCLILVICTQLPGEDGSMKNLSNRKKIDNDLYIELLFMEKMIKDNEMEIIDYIGEDRKSVENLGKKQGKY